MRKVAVLFKNRERETKHSSLNISQETVLVDGHCDMIMSWDSA